MSWPGAPAAARPEKIRRTVAGVPPWAPTPGTSSGPLTSRSSPVSPIVAPTTAPNDPIGSAPALASVSAVSTPPATLCPSAVRACCTDGASGLEVRASTNTPALCARAFSSSGSRLPKPRYGEAVTASQNSVDLGSR